MNGKYNLPFTAILSYSSNAKRQRTMKLIITSILWCVCVTGLQAQTSYTDRLQKVESGKGVVVIHQSAIIDRLVNNMASAQAAVQKSAPAAAPPAGLRPHDVPAKMHETRGITGHDTASSEHHATGTSPNSRLHINRLRRKARGYRICIFTGGNSRADRTKAQQMGAKCRSKFPELAVYTNFLAPRWVTHVGDFRTMQDAQKYVRLIRRSHFTYEVRIVSSEVNLPVE